MNTSYTDVCERVTPKERGMLLKQLLDDYNEKKQLAEKEMQALQEKIIKK